METLYTGHIHGFPTVNNISFGTTTTSTAWGSQGGLIALGVVLGSSVSLVGLAFAFITYSLFSDLRSLAGTTLLSLLASLFMGQLLFVIGVGGVQDTELCLSLALALLFMKLASLCWLCCCCHHALYVFRKNANITPQPETSMGKIFANYSLFAWGYPLLMLIVAAAFKYKEHDAHLSGAQVMAQIVRDVNNKNNNNDHCWLMEGSGYTWGFFIPALVLLFCGYYLAIQGGDAIKVSAALQIDSKIRNKMVKKRGIQIGLLVKLLILFSVVVFIGGLASFLNLPELWALYSIAQGIQGLIISMLVSCNCKILKLYAGPRSNKTRRGNYHSLRDGEGGRYGIISLTNPNYDENLNIEENTNLTKLTYTEDNFVERCEIIMTNDRTGDLVNALDIAEMNMNPVPAPV